MKKTLLITLLLFNSIVYSQVRFEGTITDSMGNTIMGANVIAIEKETKILDGFGISSDTGFYRVSLKKNTDYQIKISFIGFQQIEIDLNLSEDFEKNFILDVVGPYSSHYIDEMRNKYPQDFEKITSNGVFKIFCFLFGKIPVK